MWFFVMLAELNRRPFDFVEGESELVAGYRVEYGGGGFALIALREYSNIIFMRIFTSVLYASLWFLDRFLLRNILLAVCTVFICFLVVIIRGTLPRYRYDLLISLCWCILLPLSFSLLCLYVILC